jgi:AcrR family transcriptional regulator
MGSQERRKREKEARKEHILSAARSLLLKKGIYATTINQIAKLSELSVGTIYLYFQNKEDIFAALQEEGLELLKQLIIQAVTAAETHKEKVRAISSAYVEFSETHINYYSIITYFLSTSEQFFPKLLKNRIDRFGGKILTYCSDVIEAGIAAGEFKNVDSRKHIIWLWGSLNGLIQFRKMENTILQKESYQNLIQYALDNFIRTLINDK